MDSDTLRRPTDRSIEIQEEVVDALYEFAASIGAPLRREDHTLDPERRRHIGPALERIMAAQGYRVAELQ